MKQDHQVKQEPDPPLIPPMVITALIIGLFVLLVVVVAVGLIGGQLDTTGVALAICSLIGGLGGGAILRNLSRGGGGGQ